MGRLTEGDVRLRRANLPEMYAALRAMRNDEASVILMLRLLLIFGNLERAIGGPKITGHRFEFCIPVGRIDLLLFHDNGVATIVEAKSETASTRELVAGIGQLFLYSAGLPAALSPQQQPKHIRRVLCAPGLRARDGVEQACDLAEVDCVSLATFSHFQGVVRSTPLL